MSDEKTDRAAPENVLLCSREPVVRRIEEHLWTVESNNYQIEVHSRKEPVVAHYMQREAMSHTAYDASGYVGFVKRHAVIEAAENGTPMPPGLEPVEENGPMGIVRSLLWEWWVVSWT